MAIAVACPCGWEMAVKDDLAGESINCPLCNQEVMVPQPTGAKGTPSPDSFSAPRAVGPKREGYKRQGTRLLVATAAFGALIALVVAVWWALQSSTPLAEVRSSKKGLRVLFVGNSHTFFNDMPGMVRSLSEAAGEERPLLLVQEAPGGCTLQKHWEDGKVIKLLEEVRWDYVVLQEQQQRSSFARWQRARDTDPYARRLVAKARSAGGGSVFFQTWGRKGGDRQNVPDDTYQAMQARVRQGYRELAEELAVEVVPVGDVWEEALQRRPQLDLWAGDGYHPNCKGSYLAACTFYAAFYRHSPVGNSYMAGLAKADARFLQEVAAAVVRR